MVAVAKHIIVRALDGQVEHFHGENLKMIVASDGTLWVCDDPPVGDDLGVFKRWEYARIEE